MARLARRIASFPADSVQTAKRVLNELTMPCADAIRADARRFRQLVASAQAEARTAAARRPAFPRAHAPRQPLRPSGSQRDQHRNHLGALGARL